MKSKTTISDDQVKQVLCTLFPDGITDLVRIVAGELAQAFSLRANDKEYILRASQRSETMLEYQKENKIYDLLLGDIKVARNEKVFTQDGLVYSLAERIPGKTLKQRREAKDQTEEELDLAADQLVQILHMLYDIDVSQYIGFGSFDVGLKGNYKSWCEYLDTKVQYDHTVPWQETIAKTMMEQSVYDGLTDQFQSLMPYVPCQQKNLVHGDFSEGNVLFDNGKVTGIIDWGGAKWGDHLYDVAIFDMWTPQYKLVEKYKQKYPDFESFDERVRCYQLIMILSALGHYARNDNQHGYEWLKEVYQKRYLYADRAIDEN